MKTKNTIVAFVLVVLIGAFSVACNNAIMEKWWPESTGSSSQALEPGNGGSGVNFGIVRFDLGFEPNTFAGEGPQPKNMKIAYAVPGEFGSANGSVIGRLRPIIRNGWGFVYWIDEKGDPWNVETREVKPEDDIDGDGFITLTAVWSRTIATVQFVTNVPNLTVDSQTVGFNGTAVRPVNPQREDGYGFAGWYTADEMYWLFDTLITGDVTLYAKWDETFKTVIFNANGGRRPDGETVLTHSQTVSLHYGYIQDPGPMIREGYAFGGWYEDPSFISGKPWVFTGDPAMGIIADRVTGPENVFLYLHAKWVQNKYFVQCMAIPPYSTIYTEAAIYHGDRIIPQPSDPALDGLIFAGWYTVNGDTHPDGWHQMYLWNFAHSIVTTNMILFARWVTEAPEPPDPPDPPDPPEPGGSGANFGYVDFDPDGGVPDPRPLKIAWGGKVGRLEPISKAGYGFIGWFDLNGDPWDVETREVTEADVDGDGFIILTARWSPIMYTVSFVTNVTGVTINDQRIGSNLRIVKPVNPQRSGFGFAGWYEDPGFNGNPWDFVDGVVSRNMTLHAKWDEHFRTIIFEPNDGKRPDGSNMNPTSFVISLEYGLVQDPGPLVKTGHSFRGWYEDSGFGGNPWDFTDEIADDPSPFRLYAHWVKNIYFVTFDATPSSTIIDDQPVVYEEKAARPSSDPQPPFGYDFDNWYTENGTLWNFDTGIITEHITLYARWTLKVYTVTFNPYPESNVLAEPANPVTIAPQQVRYGNRVTQPADPPMLGDGRGFAGWYTENTFIHQWDFVNGTVMSNMTLYAKYMPQTRTIHFEVNGGADMARIHFTIPIDGMVMNPGAPHRTGHTFTGWFTDPECTIPWNFSVNRVTVPDVIIGMDPLYFYAGWTPNEYTITFSVSSGLQIPFNTQLVEHGQKAERPAAPANPGLALDGWYTDQALHNPWDFNTEVTGSRTLFANWVTATYTVTFDLRDPPGGIHSVYNLPETQLLLNEQHVPHNGTVSEPFMPALPTTVPFTETTTHSFYRWDWNPEDPDGPLDVGKLESYTFNAPVTGDIILYARWVPPVPDMVWVPRGSFIMGDTGVSGSPAAYHAYPTRRVTLDGFYISRYQITQYNDYPLVDTTVKGYSEVMQKNPSQFTGIRTRPVERVSWFDAIDYCVRLTTPSGLSQVYEHFIATAAANITTSVTSVTNASFTVNWAANGFRLPTEAEWEYAARGGHEGPPPNTHPYAGSDNVSAVAWYNITVQAQPSGQQTTQRVGLKAPNNLGIYDMCGNVSEWVWDSFTAYKEYIAANPADLNNNPKGPAAGTERVRRGGGWSNAAGNVRSVVRNSDTPNTATWVNGFRIARSPGEMYW
ncbi:MAG: InlB B-repeat-containing protein [Treponema sp.]|nr:InlB B-repeat-containing protein [Treponema sp.]